MSATTAHRSAIEVISPFAEFILSLFAALRAVRRGRANRLRAGFPLEANAIKEAGAAK